MSESKEPSRRKGPEREKGFFGRLIERLDASMKEKADRKSQQACCGGKDDKGGKCC